MEGGTDIIARGFSTSGDMQPGDNLAPDLPYCPEGARLIPLTRGLFAIVDEADYGRVAPHRWVAHRNGIGAFYARRPKGALLHRFILDPERGRLVDHIDGNGLDCRRRNMRVCSPAENSRNRKKPRSTKSRFKGVSPLGGRFQARIWINGKGRHLGTFADEIEAARAYDTAAKQFFGAFARLNFAESEGASVARHATDIEAETASCTYPRSVVPGP